MIINILVCFCILFCFIDLFVCRLYCGMKKKKDALDRLSDSSEGAASIPASGIGQKIRQILNGWMLFRVRQLRLIPSQHYRIWVLKHVFRMDIGSKVVIYSWNRIRSPWNISIGEGSVIGNDVSLDGRNFITIGKNVNISSDANIYTEQHDVNDPYFRSLASGGAVVIDDHAWVSSHTVVLPKVHIGEGAVLASGAVATKDLDAYGIYGGVPAKKIANRSTNLLYEFDGSFLPFI